MSKKLKILAIDDENDVLLIISASLKAEGFEVLTASDGEEGLDIADKAHPDVILLDVMMPLMDGFEVLEKLRENPNTQQIPVVMLTGLSDKEKIREAIDKGTQYYVVKPFDIHDLLSKIKIAYNDSQDSLA